MVWTTSNSMAAPGAFGICLPCGSMAFAATRVNGFQVSPVDAVFASGARPGRARAGAHASPVEDNWPSLDSREIKELGTSRWVGNGETVLLLGPCEPAS